MAHDTEAQTNNREVYLKAKDQDAKHIRTPSRATRSRVDNLLVGVVRRGHSSKSERRKILTAFRTAAKSPHKATGRGPSKMGSSARGAEGPSTRSTQTGSSGAAKSVSSTSKDGVA